MRPHNVLSWSLQLSFTCAWKRCTVRLLAWFKILHDPPGTAPSPLFVFYLYFFHRYFIRVLFSPQNNQWSNKSLLIPWLHIFDWIISKISTFGWKDWMGWTNILQMNNACWLVQKLWSLVEPIGNRWTLSPTIRLQTWNVTSYHWRFKQHQLYRHYFETHFIEFIAPMMWICWKKIYFKSSPHCFSVSNPQLSCKTSFLSPCDGRSYLGVTLSTDWPTAELQVLNLSLSYVCPHPLLKCYKFKRQSGNYDSQKVYIFRRQFDEIADQVLLS